MGHMKNYPVWFGRCNADDFLVDVEFKMRLEEGGELSS